jgi:hypothetical protein
MDNAWKVLMFLKEVVKNIIWALVKNAKIKKGIM